MRLQRGVPQVVGWCALAGLLAAAAAAAAAEVGALEPPEASNSSSEVAHRTKRQVLVEEDLYVPQGGVELRQSGRRPKPGRRPGRRPARGNHGKPPKRVVDVESEFGVVPTRGPRNKRHPHIYFEQYKLQGQTPQPTYQKPADRPSSQPCDVASFYRQVWLDGVDRTLSATGLWTGNGVVIKSQPRREYMLMYQFLPDPRNIGQESYLPFGNIYHQGKLAWGSTPFVEAGEARVRILAPKEGDFSQRISNYTLTEVPPYLLFNYGNSRLQMFSHTVQTNHHIPELDLDPDVPKRNCEVLRYMAESGQGPTITKWVFKKTPVRVLQRIDLDSRRYVEVDHPDDGFSYFHMGSPVMCQGRFSYVLYSENQAKFYNQYRVRAISVAFLAHLNERWIAESTFKTADNVPIDGLHAEPIRFG